MTHETMNDKDLVSVVSDLEKKLNLILQLNPLIIVILDSYGNKLYSKNYFTPSGLEVKKDILKHFLPFNKINSIVLLNGKKEIYDRIIILSESESIIYLTFYFRAEEDTFLLDYLDEETPNPNDKKDNLNIVTNKMEIITKKINGANKSVVVAAMNKYDPILGIFWKYIDSSNEKLCYDIDVILTVLSVEPLFIFKIKNNLENKNKKLYIEILKTWINDYDLNSVSYIYTQPKYNSIQGYHINIFKPLYLLLSYKEPFARVYSTLQSVEIMIIAMRQDRTSIKYATKEIKEHIESLIIL